MQVVEFNHHALGHTPPFSTKCDRTYPSRRTLPYTHADALVFRVSTGERARTRETLRYVTLLFDQDQIFQDQIFQEDFEIVQVAHSMMF